MTTDPSGAPTGAQPEPYGPPNPGPPVPGEFAPAETAPPAAKGKDVKDVKFTRAAALWTSLILGFLILIILLIFIAQNTESAEFAFLGWKWNLQLGVAILGAAVGGGLLTVAAGTIRIFQLRRAAKRNLKVARRSPPLGG